MERLVTIQLDGEDHEVLKQAFSKVEELKDSSGIFLLGEGKKIASSVKTLSLHGKLFGEGRYCSPLFLNHWECRFLANLMDGYFEFLSNDYWHIKTTARSLASQFNYLAWKRSIWRTREDE